MRLIVGLGNPGAEYARTLHNAGRWVVERVAARWGIPLHPRGVGVVGSGRLGTEPIELAACLDWMNVSGPPVKGLLRKFALTPEHLILVHDDLDLEPGRLRLKQGGGHGGHNGIKSVIGALGTPQFIRVKVGIGRPAPGQDAADYVLEDVNRETLDAIEPSLDRAVEAIACLIRRDLATAMNQYNVRERESTGEESC